ncbi:MAG: protein MalT [Desulfobacter sp.]|nr:protein MalT [Desulfobacter sp.]
MIQTGTYIPTVADALSRPRLFKQLKSHGRCRVVLVTGQAAQGKSTLVADFLSAQESPSLWFHLNQSASDHGVLFEILAQGMGPMDSGAGQAVPHVTLGIRKDLLRQVEILVTLLNQKPPNLNIILDDLESLDQDGSAFELMERLIQEAPGTTRFFLLSRVQPRINLSRLKMKKQLVCLTNADLAFTLDEALAFFNLQEKTPEICAPLETREIEKIWTITEGWAGGLTLVSESIRYSRDLNQLPEQLNSEAFSYFSSEIYQSLNPEIRDFLMKTALFEQLDTQVLASFFKEVDPFAILTWLEKKNLFIQKIDASGQWPVFKYNHLFRDFLKADLFNTLGEAGVNRLNWRAGLIYWENKDHEQAIPFFMAAKAHKKIAEIIRIKGTGDVINGRAERLSEWIHALPKDLVEKDPWLVLFATMARRIKGGKKNIVAFQTALKIFKSNKDIRGILLATAYLIEASVFIRQPSRVILEWIKQGETILLTLQGQHRFTWARTLLWQQIGLGYIAGNGDIPKGISACKNALVLAQRIENQDLMLNASVILALGFVQSGDFSGARNMLEKIGAFTHQGQYPEYRALKNITNINFALKKGDVKEAGLLLEKSEDDIEKFGLIFLYPGFVEAKAVYQITVGLFDPAIQTAEHLADFSILEGNEFYLGISHRIKAMAHLVQGAYARAVREADLAVRDLGRSWRGDIHLNLARQIKGIALFHLEKKDLAQTKLDPCLAYFKSIGADLSFCETALVCGILSFETGQDPEQDYFRLGFEKAVENKYKKFPLLNETTLARAFVLASLTQDMPDSLVGYFKKLKSKTLSREIQGEIFGCIDLADKKQRPARAEKLALLYRAAMPDIFVRTFGSFEVKIYGHPLAPSLFGGAKPLLLLKAIVAKGGKDIPKEVLIDTLWPGVGIRAGEKNFKVNLHRLRKALEPLPVKELGYVYISLKSGRISLDPGLLHVDTQMFSDRINQANLLEKQGAMTPAIEVYSKAIALYRGDYMADDFYLEWTTGLRDFFRRKCVEALAKKAGMHEEIDQWQEAVDTWMTVLSIDPCHEEAFQNLMILHKDAGLKSDALRIFEQCKLALEKELDTGPDEMTIEIYNRIKSH